MQRFVADNSLLVAWCLDEEVDGDTEKIIHSLTTAKVIVPAIWPFEFGNAILTAQRRGRVPEAKARAILQAILELPIAVEPVIPERILQGVFNLAAAHDLSTYDASYLDLALRMGLPLASLDKPLLRAAAAVGVPRYQP